MPAAAALPAAKGSYKSRLLLIAIGAALVLPLLAAALLAALIDAGRFRPQIAAVVEAATGRALRIDGKVRLELLPFPAVAVEDAALVDPRVSGTPDLARWRELSLGARLAPLLRGRLELTRLRVAGLELRLERAADGSANWSGLGSGAGRRSAPTVRLHSLDGVEIRDGRLLYVDARRGTRLEFADVSVDLPRWTAGAPLSIAAGATWRPATAPPVPIALATVLRPAGESLLLQQTRITFRWRAVPDATGLAVRLDAPRLEVDPERLTATGAPLDIRLGSKRDLLTVRDWRVAVDEGGLTAAAHLVLESTSLRRLLDESGIGAPLTSDPGALGAWRLATMLRGARGDLLLEPLELRLDATTLRGRAWRSAGGLIEAELAGDQMDIGRYLEPLDAPTPPFEFPTAALRALPARATLSLESATLGEARLEGVTLRLVGAGGGVRAAAPAPGSR